MTSSRPTMGGIIDLTDDTALSTLEEQLELAKGSNTDGKPAAQQDGASKEEDTLGAEDVIELQSFLERKSWIEDKIKFLESLPPIEVFIGVEHLLPSASGAPIPGLPTRAHLAELLKEHDAIEQETEQFDQGDMTRLKKFAKAKSRQNLSPEDTDLIEITLNTLFALDKLIHLLRGRSESLEQLGLRLTWEELRMGAWKDRESILSDMDQFIKSRAGWSPSVYENLATLVAALESQKGSPTTAPSSPLISTQRIRVDSNASVSSAGVGSIHLSSNSTGLSRSDRYKLSEALSREAASFTSRILGFRNKWIVPSASVLDKLIEMSRRPVPDQILDEQDRLEDKTNGMDGLGKFPMQLIMQWKKADEIYAELKKDQSAARALREEIDDAKDSHPSARLGEGFMSRGNALSSRLSLISDPAISRSFPRPIHPSYPAQAKTNESITTTLSTELRAAIKSARLALASAQQYQRGCELLQKVERAKDEMVELIARFEAVTERLSHGTQSLDGDGSPPDLDSEECLKPLRHGTFLALLPTLTAELEACVTPCNNALSECRIALLELQRVSLDSSFRAETETTMEKAERVRDLAVKTSRDVEKRAALIRDARKIWDAIQEGLSSISSTREQILHLTDQQRWKAERGRDGAPLTPDSPSLDISISDLTPSSATQRIETFSLSLSKTIALPLSGLLPLLGGRLAHHIRTAHESVGSRLDRLKELLRFWEDVRRQAAIMRAVRDETHDLEQWIEDSRSALLDSRRKVLELAEPAESSESIATPHRDEIGKIKAAVDDFTSKLATRVAFISTSRGEPKVPGALPTTRPPFPDSLPFNPSSLDHVVRTDVNAFTMSLAGGVESLSRNLDNLSLAIFARSVDCNVQAVLTDVQRIEKHRESLSASTKQALVVKNLPVVENILAEIADGVDLLVVEHRALGSGSLLILKRSNAKLEILPPAADINMVETVIPLRKRSAELAISRFETLGPQLDSLVKTIAQRLEGTRLAIQTDDLTAQLREVITAISISITEKEALVQGISLQLPDSSQQLSTLQIELGRITEAQRPALAQKVAALKAARIALDNSASCHDDALHPLLHPRVVAAVEAENASQSLEPRMNALGKKVADLIRILELVSRIHAEASVLATKVASLAGQTQALTNEVEGSIHWNTPETKNQLQTLADKIHTIRSGSPSTQDVAGLLDMLSDLRHIHGAQDSAVEPLVKDCATQIEKVESDLSHLEARWSALHSNILNQLDLSSRRDVLDSAISEAASALSESQDALKRYQDLLGEILSNLPSYQDSLDSPTNGQLSDLRVALEGFSTQRESSGSTTLLALQQSVTSIKSTLPSHNDAVLEALTPRVDRAQEIESTWTEISTKVSSLSSKIADAERSEADRIAGLRSEQEAMEQKRLRLEAENKAKIAAEERAALEAEKARIAAEAAALKESQEQAQRAAQERARLDAEEAERRATEGRERKEQEERRRAQWAAEEEARLAALEQAREEERLERARRDAEDNARRQREEAERLRLIEEEDRRIAEAKKHELDVFGLMIAPSINHRRTPSKDVSTLHSKITTVRARLRAIGLNAIVRPSAKAIPSETASWLGLPTEHETKQLQRQYNEVVAELAILPPHVEDPAVNAELRSLQFEVEASKPLAERLALLGAFSSSVSSADAALSDLLEHLDSYPELPEETSSSHQSDPAMSAEEQLSSRVGFTGEEIDAMKRAAEDIVDDPRVASDKERLEQTWGELWDMSMEKINPINSSRPPSVVPTSQHPPQNKFPPIRSLDLSSLSKRTRASSSLSIGLGTPPNLVNRGRQSVLSGVFPSSRSVSRISNRSVSGPTTQMPGSSSTGSLYQKPTFSSRQRTTSTSSMASSAATPRKDIPSTIGSRSRTSNLVSLASPAASEVSNRSFAAAQASRPPLSRGTKMSLGSSTATLPRSFKTSLDRSMSRPPRLSAGPSTSGSQGPRVRKTYVANKNHKVDVAVAKVVNTMDVDVNIEPVSWKDQSGKYWIGDSDPKLCFCRILRSHTVMVRVGGGWMELSKFIKTHYAEAYRLMPPTTVGSPPREQGPERWISSASLLEPPQPTTTSIASSSTRPPVTPEPHSRGLLRASLSPHPEPFRSPSSSGLGVPSNASPGSPLTPLQFIRRADEVLSPTGRPITPLASKGSSSGPRYSNAGRSTPTADPKRLGSSMRWRV